MVFHLREDDFIPRFNLACKAVSAKVESFGRPFGKDNIGGLGRAEETRDLRPRAFISLRRFIGHGMQPAVHIGKAMAHLTRERVNHSLRLLRRRGIVQIGQRFAVYLTREDRKLGADVVDVKCHPPNLI